jgi:hypothetical protein
VLALWRTPHTFGLIPLESDPALLSPLSVYTFGPIVADLAALAEPTRDVVVRLGRTLGFEWLVSLVEIDRPAGIEEPALALFLRERYDLRPGTAPNPYGVRDGELVRRRAHAIPDGLLAQFVASEAGRLEYIGTSLRRLVAPLLSTAAGHSKPSDSQQQRAAELLNALASPTRVQRFHNRVAQTPVYGLVLTNLYARALLELIELYNDTPPVAICARCNRLFVPQRNGEKHCRRYVWPWSGGEPIAGCLFDDNPTPMRAELNSEARRREYKKLQMRVLRLTDSVGPNAASTRRARAEFNEWKRAHPVQAGRRPKPMPPELLPD